MFDLEAVITHYAAGYFLMDNGDGLQWYSSRQRALMPLDGRFRYPKSLQRVLNQGRFRWTINQAFDRVVEGCADRDETWISAELKILYQELREAGWAYSFETWQGHELAGGVMGIAIGGAFIGESMFYAIPDGSKVALVELVRHLRQRQFLLFDVQMSNPHLERFGIQDVSPTAYEVMLAQAVAQPRRFYP
jgi:leucyl/phenylalanyl-tRNA---protein transferase